MRLFNSEKIGIVALSLLILVAYTNCGPAFDGALISEATDSSSQIDDESPQTPIPPEAPPSGTPNTTPTPTPTPSPSYPANPVPQGAKLEVVANGFGFTEGPVWTPQNFLLFTDTNNNRINKYVEGTNFATAFMNNSDGLNGLAIDGNGQLYGARGNQGRNVVRIDIATGQQTIVASRYDNKRFNSPNDIAVFSDNSLYFTDPIFNTPQGGADLNFRGVFRVRPGGQVDLVDNGFSNPNGIAFSPSYDRLYVADTTEERVHQFDVASDGSASNKRVFFQVPTNQGGTSGNDGMAVDEAGNIYVTCRNRIWIVDRTGQLVTSIPVQGWLTNVGFGGTDKKTLYVTAGDTLYRIRLLIPGSH